MLKGHPKGLLVLALANMGERFGYYTMLAILTLFMQAKFGLSSKETSFIYGTFLALVYFLPLIGGIIADKFLGYGKTILVGFAVMFAGYVFLSIPTGADANGKMLMFAALALIAIGTGCFKGNLQALVGNLYDDPRYSKYRDIAFSIFYMFINVGAFFAPSAANSINNAILAKHNYSYDAAIPANYVKLNDKIVEKNTFVATIFSKTDKTFATAKDSNAFIAKQAKKEGVIFTADRDHALFNLKAAALVQTGQVSKADYETLNDNKINAEDPAKMAIINNINSSSIADIDEIPGDNRSLSDQEQTKLWAQNYVQNSLSISYNMAFAVACLSLIISLLVFLGFKKTWKGVDKTLKEQLREAKASGNKSNVVQLTPAQTRERMIALLLVFFVVIFFWMSFHQNGLCLTFFARDYVQSNVTGPNIIFFNLLSLIALIVVAYGIYWSTTGILGGTKNVRKGLITVFLGMAALVGFYFLKVQGADIMKITPQIFQQFNPFFIVLLTPLSVALFSFLNSKGKEPSAPRKIGMGMFVAGLGFVIMIIASVSNGLPAPSEISGVSNILVSPNWLIGTYFTLTIAELLLSPMGLSFVAKVAPPQYKGMMQGGWLAATAVGNYLVAVMGMLWDELTLYMFWGILVICCILSAMFIFSIIKKLDRATQE
ncbi:MAG: peptide MFS transporter [Bacteroidales bacterium]